MEKAGLIGLVKLRLLPCDDAFSLRRDTLREAIKLDKQDGLIPFFVRPHPVAVITKPFTNINLGHFITRNPSNHKRSLNKR